jgi:hypothetical protein
LVDEAQPWLTVGESKDDSVFGASGASAAASRN